MRNGQPVIGENGYYISPTAWQSGPDDRQSSYVDARKVPYVAMTKADKDRGARNGDFVLLTNRQTGKQIWAVVADYAGGHPDNHAEISYAAAKGLGLRFSKDNKGLYGDIAMEFFPGTGTGVFPRGDAADYIAMGPQGTDVQLAGGQPSTDDTPVDTAPSYHNTPAGTPSAGRRTDPAAADSGQHSFWDEISEILSKIWTSITSFFGSIFHSGESGGKPDPSTRPASANSGASVAPSRDFRDPAGPPQDYACQSGLQSAAGRNQAARNAPSYDPAGNYFPQVAPASGSFNRGASRFQMSFAPAFAHASGFGGGMGFHGGGMRFHGGGHFRR